MQPRTRIERGVQLGWAFLAAPLGAAFDTTPTASERKEPAIRRAAHSTSRPFDAPPFRAPPFRAPPFRAPPFRAPPFRAPPPSGVRPNAERAHESPKRTKPD